MNTIERFANILLIAGLVATPSAQTPQQPSFEVASVKPNKSGAMMRVIGSVQPGGRFSIINVPLRDIIRVAYRLQDFQILSAPDWIGAESFDITAKAPQELMPGPPAPGGPPPPQMLMLRTLLADRFRLKTHSETREMTVYNLVMARADRKPGERLTPPQFDCPAMFAAARAGNPPPPPPPPPPGQRPRCGLGIGPGNISGGSIPMSQLALALSMQLNRIVYDRTELTGNWDVLLTFRPDQMPQIPPGALPPGLPGPPPIDPNAPSLLVAIEEQLGLRLESAKAPVDVLVIDHVERPAEN